MVEENRRFELSYRTHWKKALCGLAAAGLLAAGLSISGCSFPFTSESSSSGNSSSAVTQTLPPGEAIVSRGSDVSYSVPASVPVLMYHMVGDIPDNPAVITEENFRTQMEYLKNNGYHPITLEELYHYVTEGKELPSKPVCITFDDGYADTYSIVYPMMKEYGFPWTVFVITDMVGQQNRMTWDQLKEMADSHTVTIGNHTLSHRDLDKLSPAEQEKEIVGAKEALKQHLGVNTPWFAYPTGLHTADTVDICKKAGIKMALSMDSGHATAHSSPYEVLRVWVGNPVTPDLFADRLDHADYKSL